LARPNGFIPVYDHKDLSFKLRTPIAQLVSDEFWRGSEIQLKRASLSSNRYLTDFSFSKDATFFHNLKNAEELPVDVITHDYFIEALKPYLHEITIF
jgi:hypothetical protein